MNNPPPTPTTDFKTKRANFQGLFVESAQNFYSEEMSGRAQSLARNGHLSIM